MKKFTRHCKDKYLQQHVIADYINKAGKKIKELVDYINMKQHTK